MQAHRGHWVGTSFLFIAGRKPTYVGFLFVRGRKPTYVGFILESTRKGRLIPGVFVFSIRRFHIFHSDFFSLRNPCPLDNQRGGRSEYCRTVESPRSIDQKASIPLEQYQQISCTSKIYS